MALVEGRSADEQGGAAPLELAWRNVKSYTNGESDKVELRAVSPQWPSQAFFVAGSAIRNGKDGPVAKTSPSRPAAQVALAKARTGATSPSLIDANVRVVRARLLAKRDVLAITNVRFPTIWAWMRVGKFPRARIVGGKSMWLSTDIETWLAALPVRQLKGDGRTDERAFSLDQPNGGNLRRGAPEKQLRPGR